MRRRARRPSAGRAPRGRTPPASRRGGTGPGRGAGGLAPRGILQARRPVAPAHRGRHAPHKAAAVATTRPTPRDPAGVRGRPSGPGPAGSSGLHPPPFARGLPRGAIRKADSRTPGPRSRRHAPAGPHGGGAGGLAAARGGICLRRRCRKGRGWGAGRGRSGRARPGSGRRADPRGAGAFRPAAPASEARRRGALGRPLAGPEPVPPVRRRRRPTPPPAGADRGLPRSRPARAAPRRRSIRRTMASRRPCRGHAGHRKGPSTRIAGGAGAVPASRRIRFQRWVRRGVCRGWAPQGPPGSRRVPYCAGWGRRLACTGPFGSGRAAGPGPEDARRAWARGGRPAVSPGRAANRHAGPCPPPLAPGDPRPEQPDERCLGRRIRGFGGPGPWAGLHSPSPWSMPPDKAARLSPRSGPPRPHRRRAGGRASATSGPDGEPRGAGSRAGPRSRGRLDQARRQETLPSRPTSRTMPSARSRSRIASAVAQSLAARAAR